ncbi:MAG: glycosyltransferase family A protein [Promethearchaeota archaeon]
MIVLNGEPFIRYNLRSIYPFAHQIIIVEGASPGAVNISTQDGHSTDGTLESLRDFQRNEDQDRKITIVTAEDEGYKSGFWPGEKDEQSQAYAKRATGNYLWQIDVDEFYKTEDMQYIMEILCEDPDITAISFKQITFWGGFDYIVDGWYLRRGAEIYHRLFKWGKGYKYITHRPPTVHDPDGRDLRKKKWINGYELAKKGIILYHYSLLFPKQVMEKCDYYGTAEWAQRSNAKLWAKDVFIELNNPVQVHNVYAYPSWLERFKGKHPPQIDALRSDLESNQLNIFVRPTDDIEKIIDSLWYRMSRTILKILDPLEKRLNKKNVYWLHHCSKMMRDPFRFICSLKRKTNQFLRLKH